MRMCSAVRQCLLVYAKTGKAGSSWLDLVGYSVADLVARLKKTVPSGYAWGDYLAGKLHLDHIVPQAAFNITSPHDHDFKRCWALSNLQLLPASENVRKQARLAKPFQPSLL